MSLANLLSDLRTGVVFLAIISVLVAAHEYGHYLFARLFGMGVEEFAIGMGKKLKVWRTKTYLTPVPDGYLHVEDAVSDGARFEGGARKSSARVLNTGKDQVLQDETEFTVRMLPIGGFVRIKGMVPQDDGSEVNIPGGFYSKPPWQRLLVLLAGPVASVLSGIVVLVLVYVTYGENLPVQQAIIGGVTVDGPAANAGLRPGDEVTAIGDQPIRKFYDMVRVVRSDADTPLLFVFKRDGQLHATTVTPRAEEGPTLGPDLQPNLDSVKQGRIGIGADYRYFVLGFSEALHDAAMAPVQGVEGLIRILVRPSRFKDEAGGVTAMVAATNYVTHKGLGPTIWLAAMLSISVGIFNLLPIPPLDGGQMAVAFAELLRGGRRLSVQVQQAVMSAGLALIAVLFVVVTFIDVQRFTGKDKSPAPAASSRNAPAQPAK